MQHTKLVSLLKSFSPKEIKQLCLFVEETYPDSPSKTHVKKILRELTNVYPLFDGKEISKEKIYRASFPGKTFNDQQFRLLMSELVKWIEKFLIHLELKNNVYQQQLLLLQGLRKRNLDKCFYQELSDSYQQQNDSMFRDAAFYKRQEELGYEAYLYSSIKNNRGIDTSLQNLVDHMDVHYLIRKLKCSCEMINRHNVLSINYQLNFLDYLITYLKTYPYQDIPAVTIYFQVLLMLKEQDKEEHYLRLKSLLKKHLHVFPQQELRDIYSLVQNYCIRKGNTGHVQYWEEVFENYQLLLEKKIIFDNGVLSQFDFKNIVTIALRQNQYFWVEKFIRDYQQYLHKETITNAITYNSARLHYAKKQYREALKLLTKVEFTDVFYQLDSKILLLKVYYELNTVEPLYALINTSKTYLKRNKQISTYQLTIYMNLVKFIQKLTMAKLSGRSGEKIKQEINAVKQIADINWLLEKAEELN